MQYGALVISLDFELLWGVRDKRTIADYGANILGVRQVVPALLDLFAERNIACTWATVGLLFFATNKALLAALPAHKPRYTDARISSYHYLNEVGADEERDPSASPPRAGGRPRRRLGPNRERWSQAAQERAAGGASGLHRRHPPAHKRASLVRGTRSPAVAGLRLDQKRSGATGPCRASHRGCNSCRARRGTPGRGTASRRTPARS